MRLLGDAERLPAWNPAFSHVGPRNADGAHDVTVHRFLKGTLKCDRPTTQVIEFHIVIPGLTEKSAFTLQPQRNGTQITHTITQVGPSVAIIGSQEASFVPAKRLTRLAQTLDNHAS